MHESEQRVGVLVVGGGSAGITAAANLLLRMGPALKKQFPVTILEPSRVHYYQPMWTLVGGGIYPKEYSERLEASVIPRDARWIQDAAERFCPEENYVLTRGGQRIHYDYLIVATGLKIDWGQDPRPEGKRRQKWRMQQLLHRNRRFDVGERAGLQRRHCYLHAAEPSHQVRRRTTESHVSG